jgi:phosphatidylglycerol:prolipoprotein diacylglycerol transferase
VYYYGIIILIGFVLAALYAYKRRDDFGLTADNVIDLLLCAVVGGIVGARLYYVIFNASDYFGAGKWLNIFKVREGGLAVYGGIIGATAAVFIYGRVKKRSIFKLLDVGALGLLIGQAVGRWGNFINREAFGYITDVPWRMGLTYSTGETYYVHPTFLYESLWNVIGFIFLHRFSKRKSDRRYDGQLFLLYLVWYGFGRFIIEGFRTDSLYLGGTGVRVSQLLAGACVVLCGIALIWINRRKSQEAAWDDDADELEYADGEDEDVSEDEPGEDTGKSDEDAEGGENSEESDGDVSEDENVSAENAENDEPDETAPDAEPESGEDSTIS